LARAVRDLKLTRELFDRLLDGREFDLEGRAPRDLAELETYAEATSASLIHLSLEILGPEKREDARVAGRHVGIAYALTGLLAAVPFHARQKRVYLPEDHLAVAGVDRGLLFELQGSEPLSGVAMRLAGRAREHLEAGRAARPCISRAARMALLPAVVAERRLDRLAKADFDPFAPELADPDHLQVWHLAWKSLRGRY
jgi:phytoene synthase